VTAANLSGWRDEEIARQVGELTKDNELLLQRCRTERPFVPTRRKTLGKPSPTRPGGGTAWPASAASGTCPAPQSASGGISEPSPSSSHRFPGDAALSGPVPTRCWSGTSAASCPSRRSTARATAKYGRACVTRIS
jgi:hypothetical protein